MLQYLFEDIKGLLFLLQTEWPEGHKLAANMNFKWPQMVATPLKQLIPNSGTDGLALMRDMLMWDPHKRPTCQQVSHRIVQPAFSDDVCGVDDDDDDDNDHHLHSV